MKKLLDSSLVVAFIAGTLFFAGWLERTSYLHQLGIPASAVPNSIDDLAAIGFTSLLRFFIEIMFSYWGAAIFLVLCTYKILAIHSAQVSALERRTQIIASKYWKALGFVRHITLLIAVVVFIYAYLAINLWGRFENGGFCRERQINLKFKEPISFPTQDEKVNQVNMFSGCLVESGDKFWLIKEGLTGRMLLVREESIESVELFTKSETELLRKTYQR